MLQTSKTVVTGLLWCVEPVWLLMLWFPRSVISELGTRCRSQWSLDASLVLSELCASDHQQLSKLIEEAPTVAVKEELEKEREALVARMEAKTDQISKIRRHRLQVSFFCLCSCSCRVADISMSFLCYILIYQK